MKFLLTALLVVVVQSLALAELEFKPQIIAIKVDENGERSEAALSYLLSNRGEKRIYLGKPALSVVLAFGEKGEAIFVGGQGSTEHVRNFELLEPAGRDGNVNELSTYFGIRKFRYNLLIPFRPSPPVRRFVVLFDVPYFESGEGGAPFRKFRKYITFTCDDKLTKFAIEGVANDLPKLLGEKK